MEPGEPMVWDGKRLQKVLVGRTNNIIGEFGQRDPSFPDHAWIFLGVEGD
jgi:hypothetical protein